MAARCREQVAATFWPKVEKTATCWLWRGRKCKFGYGRMRGLGQLSTHRISYVLAHGAIPDGMWVLHRCDNSSCVRPDHLYLGDHQQNVRDMIQRRRVAYGAAHGAARLRPSEVMSIRFQYAAGGITTIELAAKFNTTQGRISSIVTGRTWRCFPVLPKPKRGLPPSE
jgi:hypothetical protein